MAIARFTDTGPELQAQDIEEVERILGAELPQDYKQFLLATNGGRPHPSSFKGQPIQELYNILREPDGFDLFSTYERVRQYLPEEVIPIGCTDLGDQICLVLKGKCRGKLFFYDHEGPTADDVHEESEVRAKIREELGLEKEPPYDWPEYPSLSLLADSFIEFVEGFYHISDEELFAQVAQSKLKDYDSDDDDE